MRNAFHRLVIACGFDLYHDSEDRRVLQTVIMPFLAQQEDVHKVLFVGCAWYTRGYRKIFARQDYVTLEIDPRAAKYGAERHVADTLENVRRHFEEKSLDLIICNGVIGWGLNEKAAVEKAVNGCFECLRVGGTFVLGWNDVPEHTPFPLDECQGLHRFTPYTFPPLATSRHLTATYNRHSYWFYRREEAPTSLAKPR